MHFEENQYDDIRMVQDLDEDALRDDVGMTKKLHCKLLLRKAQQFKQDQEKFSVILDGDKMLQNYKQLFEDNGVLTLIQFEGEFSTKLDLGMKLKIMDQDKLDAIWNKFYPENMSDNERNVPGVKHAEGAETPHI